MNLHIVAFFRFKENYLIEAIELLKKLVIETRKEEGCLKYDLIEDNENKDVFFLIELSEIQKHHHQHKGTEHLMNFRNQFRNLLEELVRVYKGIKIFDFLKFNS